MTADNNRVAVAEATPDSGTWGNDGGGGGVSDEPDFFYEGTIAQSRKVSTSRIGREYADSATVDATATDRRHFLFKINVTNYAALLARVAGPGASIKVGSGSADYDEWYVFGNDNYPVAGGWQFVVISPNVSGYKDDISNGTPDFTAVDYYSLVADFSSTSKGENVVIDAIDLGVGLKLVGGDGGDTDGVFADFLAADEGTSTGRWGYIRSLGGVYYANGELVIGENTSESAVATVFQDATGQTIVWENGMAETGYHRFRINLGGTGTDVDITGATFDSLGQEDNDADRGYTTTEDTRLVLEVSGTTGDLKFIGCTLKNLSTVTLTSAVTLDTVDIEAFDMTMAGAEIFDTIIRTSSAANVATLTDPTFGTTTDLRRVEFVQSGAGHALELDTATTYNLQEILFTGYNVADAQTDSAIFVSASSGTVTINVTDGDTPTFRTAGATVVINNTVGVNITNLIADSSLYIWEDDSGSPGTELFSDTSTATSETYSHDYTGDQAVIISIFHQDYLQPGGWIFATILSTGLDIRASQVVDRVFDNP